MFLKIKFRGDLGKEGKMKNPTRYEYRIENIQKVKLNGKKVKLFKAWRYDNELESYVFVGQFQAPARTLARDLLDYI